MESKTEVKGDRGRSRFGMLTDMKEGSCYQKRSRMITTMRNGRRPIATCIRKDLLEEEQKEDEEEEEDESQVCKQRFGMVFYQIK